VKRVKIAYFKNNLSRCISYVRDGGDLIVLDRDTPVARVVPFAPRKTADGLEAAGNKRTKDMKDDYWTEERLTEMERRGILKRAQPRNNTAWVRDLRPVKLPPGAPSVVDLLLEMRRDSTR